MSDRSQWEQERREAKRLLVEEEAQRGYGDPEPWPNTLYRACDHLRAALAREAELEALAKDQKASTQRKIVEWLRGAPDAPSLWAAADMIEQGEYEDAARKGGTDVP